MNHILSLKNQLKDIKTNKGETVQSYFIRIYQLKDQLLTFEEPMFDRDGMLVALGGLPLIRETFITTIRKNDKFPTFDELIGKCTQEETRMIFRGRSQKHEKGEPTTFLLEARRGKEEEAHLIQESLLQNFRTLIEDLFWDSNRRFKRELTQFECYNFHKHGHYARDCLEKINALRSHNNIATSKTCLTIEEEMLLMIVMKATILKRDQGIQGMEIMELLFNLNIFLFLLFLVCLLQIRLIGG